MNTIYMSTGVHPLFHNYLIHQGFRCETVPASPYLSPGIASHPDLFLCKMGCQPNSPVFYGDPAIPKDPYPFDVPYNAVCTGKYFIHHLGFTDKALLAVANDMNMTLIHVRQGYAKCNMVVVDENTLITSDLGIYSTVSRYPGIDCLLVSPGHVSLPGYPTGFLGGASGRVGERILFHGSLQNHPDFNDIKTFIESKHLEPIWFEEFPLTDIGSVVESSDSGRYTG